MADVFADITRASPAMLEVVANVLEARAALPQQRAMLDSFLSDIDFPDAARVLEVGCGTGAVARRVAALPRVAEVIAVDPSPVLLDKARALAGDDGKLSFREGDGRALAFDANRFDVAIMHSVLTHVPEPEALLGEAMRVLRPGGWLGLCEPDIASTTVALFDSDPLQTCVDAFADRFVHNRTIVRRLRPLAAAAGFQVSPMRSHALLETTDAAFTLSWIDRGADALVAEGRLTAEGGAALKAEARHRANAGTWFGFMGYASLTGRKPG